MCLFPGDICSIESMKLKNIVLNLHGKFKALVTKEFDLVLDLFVL